MAEFDDHVFRVDITKTACRKVGTESVVLDFGRSVYFGLNGSAGDLWQKLQLGATQAQLTQSLLATSPPGTDSARVATDVGSFLTVLRRHGLVS